MLRTSRVCIHEEILGVKEVKRNEGWYSKECKDATNKKNEAYKQMTQRCRTRASVEKYRQLRRKKKREFTDTIKDNFKTAWWKKLSILGCKMKAGNCINVYIIYVVCSLFNDAFSVSQTI
jgi:hypothetical protein